MENELQLLNNILKNGKLTQRDIAKSTGMSLGSVNLLINRLAKKGMLKIERLTPRSIKYILTTDGIKKRAEETYKYIIECYKLINDLNENIDRIIKQNNFSTKTQVILIGQKDEIYEVVKLKLVQMSVPHKFIDSIIDKNLLSDDTIIIYWHPESINIDGHKRCNCINLLDNI
ncbi:MAG: winged helix-turn-helix transcriptional regulator [Clostridiaceae bacterium]|nr:winged helix-turn-helix transcriptional regulator [Clostridiaceae bacterium]